MINLWLFLFKEMRIQNSISILMHTMRLQILLVSFYSQKRELIERFLIDSIIIFYRIYTLKIFIIFIQPHHMYSIIFSLLFIHLIWLNLRCKTIQFILYMVEIDRLIDGFFVFFHMHRTVLIFFFFIRLLALILYVEYLHTHLK